MQTRLNLNTCLQSDSEANGLCDGRGSECFRGQLRNDSLGSDCECLKDCEGTEFNVERDTLVMDTEVLNTGNRLQ